MSEAARRFDASARIMLLRQALGRTPDDPTLLFALAETLAEIHRYSEAARVFRQAFLRDPNRCPWPGDEASYGNTEAVAELRDQARSVMEQGAVFTPMIATLAIAEGLLGNEMAVRKLVDYDRFFRYAPAGIPDAFTASDFHSVLAAEIKSSLKFYDQPTDRALRKGWRSDGLLRSRRPASRALSGKIRDCVDQYIAGLPDDPDHPFPASRPSAYVLNEWAIVSNGDSHHISHIHFGAWLSGVYYVVKPPASSLADGQRGWLRVGPPDWKGNLKGWQSRLVEPQPGNLVLMPGYFFHETVPLGVHEERICVAFDVVPAELADSSASDY
jgi:hypothetical protein